VPDCTGQIDKFPPMGHRQVGGKSEGGDVIGDAGALLVRRVDRQLGLLHSVAERIVSG
jgi:hypothetical protein